uniref:Glycoside hydrolase 35 catalytic domain-containing protein n=1 Tax=Meloidogyne floridensis TaxID=298350 RepID=A0A915PAS6_9BILA
MLTNISLFFHIHPWLWHDRLYKVRAAGLNAVQVYVPWNFHEEEPASFNFGGDRDLAEFLRIAQHNGLYVLLRIGPYVCAEIEFGGLPWWLIKDQANIELRTSNKKKLSPQVQAVHVDGHVHLHVLLEFLEKFPQKWLKINNLNILPTLKTNNFCH